MRRATALTPPPLSPRRSHPGRRAALLAAVALLAMAALPTGARAAEGGLVVIAQSTYQVLPDEARVRVTVDAVATSFEPDTPDAQVFYSGLTFAVQPGATNVSASAGGQPLRTRIAEQTEDYTAIEVTFGRGVFFGQSYAYRVSFDLVDAGGDGGRDFRIGRSLVAFPVWAFGTEGEPGSSVRVELPAGFTPDVQGDSLARTNGAGGVTILSASPGDPVGFFAYVSADRPGAFAGTPLSVPLGPGPADILIRAWDDDPAWGTRMVELMTDGLPALEELVGVDYPASGRLVVEEAAISRLGEYAGIYNANTGVIRVRYDADAYVALHEAAHIWFNGDLFRERWINEAWAEFYSVEAGGLIGASGGTFELTPELLAVRIPLNDWGAIGVENLDVEDFAYAATYELALQVAERTDLEALRSVWRAAFEREMAYQPIHASGQPALGAAAFQPDWQRLLDLLEERTAVEYDDLWVEWVVNAEQRPLLNERASARFRYGEVVAAAGDWELPAAIRAQLGEWEFDAVQADLGVAEEILDDRDEIAHQAGALDLEPSRALRAAFEGDGGLDEAAVRAAGELTVLVAIDAATDRLGEPPTALESLGLLGADPDAQLTAARSAYEAGELSDAEAAATAAGAERDAAGDTGTDRAVLGAAGLLLLDGLAMLGLSLRAGRRRGEPAATLTAA